MDSVAAAVDGQKRANDWELGCAHDEVRINFVVPTICRMFSDHRPNRILDVGAGTGFVARSIDLLLPYRAQWTLIDRDIDRLDIAGRKAPNSMQVELCHGNIGSTGWNVAGASFDAILVCFTILEIPDYSLLLEHIVQSLAPNGIVIIVTPDPWEEVAKCPLIKGELLSGRISITKIDKFTHQPYPYFLSRNEDIMACALNLGLALEDLIKPETDTPVYVMMFRRKSTQALSS